MLHNSNIVEVQTFFLKLNSKFFKASKKMDNETEL